MDRPRDTRAAFASSREQRISALLCNSSEPAYRLNQILDAVYRGGIEFYSEIGTLPRQLRNRLADELGNQISTLQPRKCQQGHQVEKVLFESIGGARMEAVYSRYRSGFRSLCLSTQVGCGLGCSFCATGAVGLVRNLSADEICDQVLHWWSRSVHSVAFMGMGEALANPHTFEALRTLTDRRRFGLAPRRITVSTVGFLPGLRRLVAEQPKVTITISVHSPYDEERGTLIPLQHRFRLHDNLEVLDEHVGRTRRKAYLAYLLIAGVNDSEQHAKEFASLVRARANPGLFHVSVIPYNEAAGVRADYRRPSPQRVGHFLDILRGNGLHATRRQQFGDDQESACGQLHAAYLNR